MPIDNSVDRCKPYACPRELRLLMEPLERRKEPFGVSHIESGPVITDEVGRDAVGLGASELDDCLGLSCAELPGISQQVLQQEVQKPAVAFGDHFTRNQRLDLLEVSPLLSGT